MVLFLSTLCCELFSLWHLEMFAHILSCFGTEITLQVAVQLITKCYNHGWKLCSSMNFLHLSSRQRKLLFTKVILIMLDAVSNWIRDCIGISCATWLGKTSWLKPLAFVITRKYAKFRSTSTWLEGFYKGLFLVLISNNWNWQALHPSLAYLRFQRNILNNSFKWIFVVSNSIDREKRIRQN